MGVDTAIVDVPAATSALERLSLSIMAEAASFFIFFHHQ